MFEHLYFRNKFHSIFINCGLVSRVSLINVNSNILDILQTLQLNETIPNTSAGFIKFKHSLHCIRINNYLLSNFKYGLVMFSLSLFSGCIENLKNIKKTIIY